MKKTLIATLMAVCLMVGSSAFAQDNACKSATPKERPTAEQMAQRRTEHMTKALNLTEAQAKQIYQVNLEQAKAMDNQAQKVKKDKSAEQAKMKSILTEEQYTKWSQMQEQHRMGKPGEGGPHGKMMGKPGMKCDSCANCPKAKKEKKADSK